MRIRALIVLLALAGPALRVAATPPNDLAFAAYVPSAQVEFGAGEPTLAVQKDGSVLFQTLLSTMRVSGFRGTQSRWTDVTPAWVQSKGTLDPILSQDDVTGRTFVSHLEGACSLMAATDDGGRTWTPSPLGCGVGTLYDHQSVGAGPFPASAAVGPVGSYPHAVYYCAHDNITATCAVSVDGGATFGPGVPAWSTPSCYAPHGHLTVAADGTAYLPPLQCLDAVATVAVSEDAGLTWTLRRLPGTVMPGDSGNPSVATAGRAAYFTWGGSGHAWAAVTRDKGRTWSRPAQLDRGLGLRDVRFLTAVGGDENRAAVAFLGTTATGNASSASFTGQWRPYVAITLHNGRTWRTRPVAGPVHRGGICLSGVLCNAASRVLLDFDDIAVDRAGRLHLALAISCADRACTRAVSGNDQTRPLLLRQVRGPLLRR